MSFLAFYTKNVDLQRHFQLFALILQFEILFSYPLDIKPNIGIHRYLYYL